MVVPDGTTDMMMPRPGTPVSSSFLSVPPVSFFRNPIGRVSAQWVTPGEQRFPEKGPGRIAGWGSGPAAVSLPRKFVRKPHGPYGPCRWSGGGDDDLGDHRGRRPG